MADDLNFGIRAEAVDSSWSEAGRDGGRAFAKGIKPIEGAIQRSIDQVGSKAVGIFGDKAQAAFKKAEDAARRAEDATRGIADGAREARDAFNRIDNNAENLALGIAALRERTEAFQRSLSASGAETGMFAVYDREFEELINLADEVKRNFNQIADSPELQKDIQRRLKLLDLGLSKELQAVKSVAKTERDVRDQQAAAERGDRANLSRQKVALTNAESRQTVVALQKETTLRKQSARFRLELARQVFNQVRVIERSIGAVFKGTAAIVQGAFARVERTVFRIGGVFKRGNKNYTAGLQPALTRREGIIKRSFGRQEAAVRGSVGRQSRTIQRFETQASTGIAGAVTGRSSLGALFGGGLALGGGFTLFRKLSQSIQVGGDFVQGLAVLQQQLQLTEDQMAGVRQLSIDLGNDITLPGVSALDAAQAIAALTKQFGALGDAALPAAEAAAKGVLSLSRATGASAEDAAAIVGAATNVFGIGADQAVETADKITAALTRAAGVGVTEFKDSFTQAANVFSLFQKPALGAEGALVELNTALAVLAKGGLTGSQAGTGLKQFFIQATKSGDAFVALRKQIAETAGVSGSVFFDADGNARAFTESIDILRRGLRDLTEEERSTTLVKLFGARATTVANILINEQAESFDLLREAQKRQGAAADIATAQNVGLRGALDAFQSVLETQQIKTYEKWQGAAAGIILKLADLFQAFFDGEGKIKTFRDALVGVTVALGGLLALKGAFELTKFLGIGLTGLISPLGLVVVGVGALGAAIGVLVRSSDTFRESLSNIGSSLGDAVGPIVELAGDLLANFTNLLNDKVVPAIVNFSLALADTLETQVGRFIRFLQRDAVPALERFGRAFIEIAGPILRSTIEFIASVVNPVLERLGQLIQITVVPAFNKLSEVLEDKVDPALQKIRDVGGAIKDEIEPLVRPAIDAFRELGDAIGAIAGKRAGTGFADSDLSDLSALGPAFANVVTGIAESFVNIGERIIDVLGEQLPKVLGFITSFFTPDRLIGIVAAFGRLAESIGKAIGAIASSPEFLGALAAIAGTAGFLAVKFVEGLAKGLAIGIPRTFDALGDLIGDEFDGVLKAAFDPANIAKAVLAGFAIAGIGAALVSTLRRPVNDAGKKVGGGFTRSLLTSARQGFSGVSSRNQFASGFFGGLDSFDRQAAKIGTRTGRALAREQTRAADTLRVLGRTPKNNIGRAFIGPVDPRGPSRALDGLIDKYGAAAVAGAELRARTNETFRQVGIGAQGVGQILGGEFRKGFTTARTAARGFATSLAGTLAAAGRAAKVTAVGVGQALGGAMVAGIGAALSGQALGTADSAFGKGIGLAGVLSSGLFASLAFGGPGTGVGAAVGVATVGVGLLSAAFAANGEAAKEAAAKVQGYVDVLGDLDPGDQLQATAEKIDEAIGGIDVGLQELLTGFDVRGLASAVLDGVDPAIAAASALAGQFDISNEALVNFLKVADTSSADALVRSLFGATGASRTLRDSIDQSDVSIGEFADLLSLFVVEGESVDQALTRIALAATRIVDEVPAATEASGELVNVFETIGGIGDLLRIPAEFRGDIDKIRESLAPVPPSVTDIISAIQGLDQERLTGIQEQIGEVTGALDVTKERVAIARGAIFDFFSTDYAGSTAETVDNLILGVGGVSESLATALKDGANSGSTVATSAFDQAIQGFRVSIKGVGERLLDEFGTDLRPERIREEFAGVRAAINEELQGRLEEIDALEVSDELSAADKEALKRQAKDAAQVLLDTIGEFTAAEDFEANIEELKLAEEAQSELQEQLDALQLQLTLPVEFSAAQIAAALRDAGLDVEGFDAAAALATQDRLLNPLTGSEQARFSQIQREAELNVERQRKAKAPTAEDLRFENLRPDVTVNNYNDINVQSTAPLTAAEEVVRSLVSSSVRLGSGVILA